jgi:hypothetical protein
MKIYRKTPLLLPGVGPFSNANIFVWDQFIKENKTDFKFSTCLLFNLVLYNTLRHSNKKILAFENWPTPGTKSGVFR